ncbi:outer membrane homotrimeric porin [Desulfovibrio sp. OttesenSCG-928-C06]|nr:outer membrane homotrimeric porin [Desulfovibrio sp. OttesenSCG-928-C06]
MKRLVTLMLAAMMTLSMAATASALEINVKGNFHFSFRWDDQVGSKFQDKEEDNFLARQRMRIQIDFVASENLKGVLYMHSGNMFWGNSDQGAALDTTKNSMKVRHAYIDWTPVDTALNVKIGLQQVTSPAFAAGSTFTNDAMAGITLSNKFSDNVTATLGWYRPYNDNKKIKDSMDMFMFTLPLNFDGVKITPWGEYSFIGRDAEVAYQAGPFTEKRAMWHAGVATEFNPIDPLTIAFDFTYGAIDSKNSDPEADGFLAATLITFDVDFSKLMLGAWYASGHDKDDYAKGEYGTMPNLLGTTGNADPGFNMTGLGFWGNNTPLAGAGIINKSGVGTWGIMLGMKDLSFVTDLSHMIRVAYYEGTSDKEVRGVYAQQNDIFMNEKDSAFEINFDTKYQIAKGLSMSLDTGIVFMDWQSSYEKANNLNDTMWRIVFGVQYAF